MTALVTLLTQLLYFGVVINKLLLLVSIPLLCMIADDSPATLIKSQLHTCGWHSLSVSDHQVDSSNIQYEKSLIKSITFFFSTGVVAPVNHLTPIKEVHNKHKSHRQPQTPCRPCHCHNSIFLAGSRQPNDTAHFLRFLP